MLVTSDSAGPFDKLSSRSMSSFFTPVIFGTIPEHVKSFDVLSCPRHRPKSRFRFIGESPGSSPLKITVVQDVTEFACLLSKNLPMEPKGEPREAPVTKLSDPTIAVCFLLFSRELH